MLLFFLLRLPQPQGDKEDFSEYEGPAMDRSTLGNLLADAWHTFICEVELLQNQKMLLCQENCTHQKEKEMCLFMIRIKGKQSFMAFVHEHPQHCWNCVKVKLDVEMLRGWRGSPDQRRWKQELQNTTYIGCTYNMYIGCVKLGGFSTPVAGTGVCHRQRNVRGRGGDGCRLWSPQANRLIF